MSDPEPRQPGVNPGESRPFRGREDVNKDDLCAATGYDYSGGFRNALSDLRTAGVLVGKNTGEMRANRELFGEDEDDAS